MQPSPILAVTAVAALLAGCASGAVRVLSAHNPSLDPETELQYAAREGRSVPVEVRGAAFPIPSPDFAAAVAEAMAGANHGPPVRFTATPSERDRLGYTIVMRFNGPRWEQDQSLCTGGDAAAVASAGRTRLAAALCLNRELISATIGEVDGASGTADPRFRALVRDVVAEITRRNKDVQFDNDGGSMPPT